MGQWHLIQFLDSLVPLGRVQWGLVLCRRPLVFRKRFCCGWLGDSIAEKTNLQRTARKRPKFRGMEFPRMEAGNPQSRTLKNDRDETEVQSKTNRKLSGSSDCLGGTCTQAKRWFHGIFCICAGSPSPPGYGNFSLESVDVDSGLAPQDGVLETKNNCCKKLRFREESSRMINRASPICMFATVAVTYKFSASRTKRPYRKGRTRS